MFDLLTQDVTVHCKNMPLEKLNINVIPPLARLSLQRTFQVQPLIFVTITQQASKMLRAPASTGYARLGMQAAQASTALE